MFNWMKKRVVMAQQRERKEAQVRAVVDVVNELGWLSQFEESILHMDGSNIYAEVYVTLDDKRVRQAQGIGNNLVEAIRDLRRILVEQGQISSEEIKIIVAA
jgi:hypothetical protein